jgi:hypothetical protein
MGHGEGEECGGPPNEAECLGGRRFRSASLRWQCERSEIHRPGQSSDEDRVRATSPGHFDEAAESRRGAVADK